jgi:hypothetical protein
MLENRKSARQLTFRTGRITTADEPDQIECAILNLSRSGACILVPYGARIAEVFVLAIDRDDAVRSCRCVWREGPRIGVAFLDHGQPASRLTG